MDEYYLHLREKRMTNTFNHDFDVIPTLLYSCFKSVMRYGVATISRLLKNIGLFCKRAL